MSKSKLKWKAHQKSKKGEWSSCSKEWANNFKKTSYQAENSYLYNQIKTGQDLQLNFSRWKSCTKNQTAKKSLLLGNRWNTNHFNKNSNKSKQPWTYKTCLTFFRKTSITMKVCWILQISWGFKESFQMLSIFLRDVSLLLSTPLFMNFSQHCLWICRRKKVYILCLRLKWMV